MIKGERILARLKETRHKRVDLARAVGISPQALTKIINGTTAQTNHIYAIAKFLETTPEFLMGDSDAPSTKVASAYPLESFDDDVEVDRIDLAYGMGGTYLDSDAVDVEKVRFTRGFLRTFTDSSPSMLFVAQGVGDSMNPTIQDNDVVLVDRAQNRPRMNDQIWAMSFAGVGMIKRLRPSPDGSMRILSDNAQVSDDRAADGELHIIGRVVAIVRKV